MLKRLLVCVLLLFLIAGVAVGQTGKDIRAKDLYVGGRWAKFRSYVEIIVFGNGYDALRLNYTGSGHNIFDMQADGVSVMKLEKDGTLTLVGTLDMAALSLTGDTDPLLDLNPSGTSSQDVINITPSAAMGAAAVWEAIKIDAGLLDPSAASAEIYGFYADFSGVNLGNEPVIKAIYIVMPANYTGQSVLCAFKATGNGYVVEILDNDKGMNAFYTTGRVRIDYTTGNVVETNHTLFTVDIDADSMPDSSLVHALDVTMVGTTTGEVAAVGTWPGVRPIHQHIGTYVTPNQTNYAARWPNGGAWTAGIDTNQVMVANLDEIFIGSPNLFDAIRVEFTVFASKDVFEDYYYYDTGLNWVEFFPQNTLNGWRSDGIASWDPTGFTNWKDNYNPGGGGAGYFIKVKRTRVSPLTPPTPFTVEILASTTYQWDENGDLDVNNVTLNDLTTTLTTTYTPSAAQVIDAVGDAILANATTIVLDPDADYVLTSTPTIADGTNGQVIYVTCGDGETNVVTIQDQGTLGGSNIILLRGATSRDITGQSTVSLRFSDTAWKEFGGAGAGYVDATIVTGSFDGYTIAEAITDDITGISSNNPVIRKISLWISNDPTGDENINCRLSFYDSASMTEDELIVAYYFSVTYTETDGGASVGHTTDVVDTTSGLVKYDLIRYMGGTAENVRITATPTATGLTFTALAYAHNDDTGVVKVVEITGMQQLYDADGSNEIHARLETYSAPNATMDIDWSIDLQ